MANNEFTFDEDIDMTAADLEKAIASQVASSSGDLRNVDPNEDKDERKASDKDDLEEFFKDPNRFSQRSEDDDNEIIDDATDDEPDLEGKPEIGEEGDEGDEDEDDIEQEDDPDNEVDESEDDEVLSTLLEIIKQEQLLDIPDDFDGQLDEQKIEELKRRTYQNRDRQIIESRRAMYANDPEKLAYFDYFMAAGPDADLPSFRNTVDNIKSYENFDVSNEENQREIIAQYLREGLDPNNPAHKLRLSKVDKEVEEIMSNYEGEDRASEAKEYFIDKYGRAMQEELQRAEQAEQQRIQYQRMVEQQEAMWEQEFRKTLSNNSWSQDKKQAVMNEYYTEVMLEDGSYAPVWYVKEQVIKSNPEFYQRYLDWLNTSFDLDKMSFVDNNPGDTKSEVTRKILSLVNKKNSGAKPKSSTSRKGGKRRQSTEIVDPRDAI